MAVDSSKDNSKRRLALIIATSEYQDPDLQKLISPVQDAKALSEVLSDPHIGNFEVKILHDQPSYKIKQEIEEFFGSERNRDDLLLLYFSCHGIKGTDGQLYFATYDTKGNRLFSTAVRAKDVNELMTSCLAWRQVLILDCCYSGAFARGMTVRGDKQIHTNEHFEGRGRMVMTASDSMQYSFEGTGNVKQEQENIVRSFFTDALIEGLKTGEADRDGNGKITYDELYDYVSDQVRKNSPKQSPRKWGFDVQGEILIAKNLKTILKESEKPIDSQFLLKLLQDSKIEEFNKLRNEHDIPLYFRRADLTDKNLTGVDLHEVDLTEIKLTNSKLNSANLNSANLKGADLSGADLRSADLYGANLTKANLSGVNLRGADLKGMVNFTGANLTQANLRGADLSGMVNFDGAVLHDVDFTGAITDKALIKLDEADIHNAKGLPSLQKSNEYLEALKSFSKAINQQFKTHNISPEQLKPIEESIKELVKEVEDIKEPEKINNVEKKNLHTKFAEIAQKVIQPLPKTSETLSAFTSLEPLNKLLGEEVLQLAETIIEKIKEEDNKTKADNNAEEWYKKGLDLFNSASYGEAVEYFNNALEINYQNPEIWYKKGNALYQLNKYSDAIKCYDEALKINPKSADTWYSKGTAFYYKGKYNEAIESYEQVLKIDPKNITAWIAKANSLNKLSKHNEAVICYDKVLQIDPNNKVAQESKEASLKAISAIAAETRNSRSHTSSSSLSPPSTSQSQKIKQIPKLIGKYSFITKWGSKGTAKGQFSFPTGIAIDSSDNVYVADIYNNRIQKFTRDGTFITKWGHNGSGNGRFSSPGSIAIDSSGNVYVAEQGNNRIQKFTSDGTFITAWGTSGKENGQFKSPLGIAIDSSGNVYVADYGGNNRIQKFTSDGTFITKWGSKGAGNGQFDLLYYIAIDSKNNVYVVDDGGSKGGRIQKFTADGEFITKWGSKGTGEGQFLGPRGVAIDSSGNVYVSEHGNNRIQKFTSDGTFITAWGTSGKENGQFKSPLGIAIDSEINVYVVDSYNNRIQVFAPTK